MIKANIICETGNNDNPNSVQLSSSYRKLLFEADLEISVGSNVQFRGNSNVLTVSSASSKRYSTSPQKENSNENSNPFLDAQDEIDDRRFEFELEHFTIVSENPDSVQNAGLVHMSYELERRLKNSDIYCSFCMNDLIFD